MLLTGVTQGSIRCAVCFATPAEHAAVGVWVCAAELWLAWVAAYECLHVVNLWRAWGAVRTCSFMAVLWCAWVNVSVSSRVVALKLRPPERGAVLGLAWGAACVCSRVVALKLRPPKRGSTKRVSAEG